MLQLLGRRRASRAAGKLKKVRSTKAIVGAVCEAMEPRAYLTVTFSSPNATALTGVHGPLIAGQFDSSSDTDLAVGTTTSVKILLGNSVGTLTSGGTIAFPGNAAANTPFLVGNFKGTGSDIVLLSQNSTTHNGAVTYEASQGDGTFIATLTSNITNGGNGFLPIAGAVGDFDGDGNDDLAIVGKPTTGTTLSLAILTSNDDGSFTEAHDYPITGSVATGSLTNLTVIAKDFGQGAVDVAINDSTSSHLDVFMNAGDATFSQLTPTALTASLLISDVFTTSGVSDLVAASGSQLTVLLGDGDGTFSAQSPIAAGGTITSLSSADLDLDGNEDLITNLGVSSGDGDGSFEPPVTLPVAEGGSAFSSNIIPADVDGDGRLDIVGISSAPNALLNAKNVSMANSGTEITSNENPANPGDDVQLTATVSSALNLNATGQVEFFDNGVSIGTAQLADDGTATLDAGTALTAGAHSITATYDGDFDFAGSTSLAFLQTILAPTTTVLVSSANPSNAGADVTITATVSGNDNNGDIPSGNVEFFDGGVDLGGAVLDANGNAVLDSSTFVGGIHQITAQYDADTNYQMSTSAALAQTINTPALVPVVQTSTLPKSFIGIAKVHGVNVVFITNTTAATISGPMTVSVLASGSGGINGAISLASVTVKNAVIKPGATLTVKVPVKSLPNTLTTGSYTLIAEVMYGQGSVSAATSGPTIALVSPFVSLAETFPAIKLPSPVVGTAKINGSVKVLVTNSGNVPSKGATVFALSASNVQDQPGTAIPGFTKNLTIPAGGSRLINIPIKSIPVLVGGDYFLVVQVTDPNGNVSFASTDSTVTIAAPVITLAAAIGAVKNPSSGAVLTITNNGNLEDDTTITATLGFSSDAAGAQPVGGTTAAVTPTLRIKPGKSVKVHLNQWKLLLSGLPAGGTYFLTAVLSDLSSNSAFAVSATSFSL